MGVVGEGSIRGCGVGNIDGGGGCKTGDGIGGFGKQFGVMV